MLHNVRVVEDGELILVAILDRIELKSTVEIRRLPYLYYAES